MFGDGGRMAGFGVGLQTVRGERLTVGGVTVRPVAQAVTVRLPLGGFVWIRPAAVLVEQDGRLRRMRVLDLTRLLQLALFGFALAVAIGGPKLATRRRRDAR